jgi:hypothetical protein
MRAVLETIQKIIVIARINEAKRKDDRNEMA